MEKSEAKMENSDKKSRGNLGNSTKKKRKRKRVRIVLKKPGKILLCILLIIAILGTAAAVAAHERKKGDGVKPAQSDSVSETAINVDQKLTNGAVVDSATIKEAVDTVLVETGAGEASGTGAPDEVIPTTQAPQTAGGSTVPQNDPVGDDYFNDAVFVGDSRTQGFMMYSGLSGATFYAAQGLNVKDVFDKSQATLNGQKVSIATALSQASYSKAYLMLGINEMGWVYPEKFVEKYGQIIDTIRSTHPDAVIYLQSLLPVTAQKSAADLTTNNVNVDRFNVMIQQLAKDKGVFYLNVREAVQDTNGNLCDDATTDGVHLNKDYCLKWLEYLKSHTI